MSDRRRSLEVDRLRAEVDRLTVATTLVQCADCGRLERHRNLRGGRCPDCLAADARRLDWLESRIQPAKGDCEVYLAGLRYDLGAAVAYRIEANPPARPTVNVPTLRGAIDKAMAGPPGEDSDV